MKKAIIFLLTAFVFNLKAQHLFPVKLNNCNTSTFCLDCGDITAGYSEIAFKQLEKRLSKSLYLKGIKGTVKYQVLVDSSGNGCVLSHTDKSLNSVTLLIMEELNKFKNWTPAIENNVKPERSSITIVVTIMDNKISGRIERVDMNAVMKAADVTRDPEIYNKKYVYKNENLANYKITVWNTRNSNLPENLCQLVSIDKSGLIWLATRNGLFTFNGDVFQRKEQNITVEGKYFGYYKMAIDSSNTKWFFTTDGVYSLKNNKWVKYSENETGIKGGYRIINNSKTDEVFFCSERGLTILKNREWKLINLENTPGLPSSKISFAKRDSKNRIWIGTAIGSAMIDENNIVTNFQNSNTVLKDKRIRFMDEDEQGNIYFTLYEFNPKDKKQINNNEGIAVRYTDGTFKQFTTENSGMPFNYANCLLYDKREKVIWISTERAGLVRFDPKSGWENYHNQNSDIPTSYILDMTFDSEGNLYLATQLGLVKVEKK